MSPLQAWVTVQGKLYMNIKDIFVFVSWDRLPFENYSSSHIFALLSTTLAEIFLVYLVMHVGLILSFYQNTVDWELRVPRESKIMAWKFKNEHWSSLCNFWHLDQGINMFDFLPSWALVQSRVMVALGVQKAAAPAVHNKHSWPATPKEQMYLWNSGYFDQARN